MAQGFVSEALVCPMDLAAVQASAAGMNCLCHGRCNATQALACLYHNTLDILSHDNLDPEHTLDLLRPLAVVISHQTARAGQRDCMAFAATLAAGDHAGALAACHRMIETEAARQEKTQG